MPVVTARPDVDGMTAAVDATRTWQHDAAPVPLHPGDLGWFWRFGAGATAAAVRTWSRDGRVLAVGLLDGPGLVRLAVAPDAQDDEELARRMADDVARPGRGVLPDGEASVEARWDGPLAGLLLARGWDAGEPWTPLRRDLAEPVEDCGLRVEVTGPEQVRDRVAVHRASFKGSTFTDGQWHAMAAGPAYTDARCLVAHDDQGTPVAAATVWSAGPGRPGLLEPVGVHREHRGHGYGRAIGLAAAAGLQALGASSATVCTPGANVAAVATYRSAGFQQLPDVRDVHRPGPPS